MKWKILIVVGVAALSGAGIFVGMCARQEARKEHKAKVEAQVAQHRAETEAQLPAVCEEAQEATKQTLAPVNEQVRKALPEVKHGPDANVRALADAINATLGID